jgi:glucose-1-phosphate adenylyltransferase
MKTRAIILAGGEGTRLGVLTAKRTKPAVPFAGKYRIIDFPLSNCVNSELFDVMIVAQYRPHSLIEHIGAGGPWDLNRDFTGGVRIYTPYRARGSDWFIGTADAVQQNYSFIKRDNPDCILVLSGDHVYTMDYRLMMQFHQEHQADLTIAVIQVPMAEASRFGILNHDSQYRVTSFVEKPKIPESNLVNMGVYLFNNQLLDNALWEDHLSEGSSHDFGKDIIPNLIAKGAKVFAYPYSGYWVDVGTVNSYWNAHMDLLDDPPKMDLYSRSWVIHTRTEERPPARFSKDSLIEDSMISDGCVIESGAQIQRSFLSPGVIVHANAIIRESIILTDSSIAAGAVVERAVIDKRVKIGAGARVGAINPNELQIAMVGKNSAIPDGLVIEPLGMVGVDVCYSDFPSLSVQAHQFIQTKRLPNEI